MLFKGTNLDYRCDPWTRNPPFLVHFLLPAAVLYPFPAHCYSSLPVALGERPRPPVLQVGTLGPRGKVACKASDFRARSLSHNRQQRPSSPGHLPGAGLGQTLPLRCVLLVAWPCSVLLGTHIGAVPASLYRPAPAHPAGPASVCPLLGSLPGHAAPLRVLSACVRMPCAGHFPRFWMNDLI